jgi:putative oxidoreductase
VNKDNMLNLSLFVLRMILGAIFIVHGAQKLFGMFDGMGIEGTAKMLEGFGFANADILALVWASVEFAGGIFLVLGITARWAALAVAFFMVAQLWKANLAYGLLVQSGEFEHTVLLITSCVPVILLGGGSWSVWDV